MRSACLLAVLLISEHACLLASAARPLLTQGSESAEQSAGDGTDISVTELAADIAAHLAVRLAQRDSGTVFGRKRRRAYKYHMKPEINNVSDGMAEFVPVEFMGHTLTLATLKNDEFISTTIRRNKAPFQRELLGALMELIVPGSTVVDAGANLGQFSAFFAATTGPSGMVVSFEPQMRMFEMLCTNAVINSMRHIRPQNKALSDKPGSLHMTSAVVDGSNTGKSYAEVDKEAKYVNYGGMRLGASGEEVQAVTLDSYNLTNVSLIKVDVQGAEKLMFYGAQDTIKRNMPVIAYEAVEAKMAAGVEADLGVSDAVKNFSVEAFLESLGYKRSPKLAPYEKDGDWIMVPPNHPHWNT